MFVKSTHLLPNTIIVYNSTILLLFIISESFMLYVYSQYLIFSVSLQ